MLQPQAFKAIFFQGGRNQKLSRSSSDQNNFNNNLVRNLQKFLLLISDRIFTLCPNIFEVSLVILNDIIVIAVVMAMTKCSLSISSQVSLIYRGLLEQFHKSIVLRKRAEIKSILQHYIFSYVIRCNTFWLSFQFNSNTYTRWAKSV